MNRRKCILKCVVIAFLIGAVGYIGSYVLSRNGCEALFCGYSTFFRKTIFVLGLATVLGIFCRKCSK